jgi:hypothetical protein
MRRDDPRAPIGDEPEVMPPMRGFFDTLVLARAIELLPPVCRAALSAVYAEHKDPASLAADLDTDPAYARKFVTNCEQRLFEIYDALATVSPHDEATVPQWVSEREHAAAGSSRRR